MPDATTKIWQLKTNTGRVVYPRKKHYYTLKDVYRIFSAVTGRLYKEEDIIDKLRENNRAITIRALKFEVDNLYGAVWDLFYNEYSRQDIQEAKALLRVALDNFVDIVATWVYANTGFRPLAGALSVMGRVINRGMEYIFTGSTGY